MQGTDILLPVEAICAANLSGLSITRRLTMGAPVRVFPERFNNSERDYQAPNMAGTILWEREEQVCPQQPVYCRLSVSSHVWCPLRYLSHHDGL